MSVIEKLLKRPSPGKLSPAQREAVEAHCEAAAAWQNFLTTGKPRSEGVAVIDRAGKFPFISSEEREASAKAREALVKALALFEKRGLREADYDALREHAAQHWHPAYAEHWPHHVRAITRDLRIGVEPALQERIEKEFFALVANASDSHRLAASSRRSKAQLH